MTISLKMLRKATHENLIRLAKFLELEYDCSRECLEMILFTYILENPTPKNNVKKLTESEKEDYCSFWETEAQPIDNSGT